MAHMLVALARRSMSSSLRRARAVLAAGVFTMVAVLALWVPTSGYAHVRGGSVTSAIQPLVGTHALVTAPSEGDVFRIGDEVVVRVDVVGAADDLVKLCVGINRAGGASTRTHGVLAWFRSRPSAPWVAVRHAPGSWFAYYDDTDIGSHHIQPDLAGCAVDAAAAPSAVTFRFRIREAWGDVQDNSFDTLLATSTGTSSGWVAGGQAVDVLPGPVSGVQAQVAGAGWYEEADDDRDGLADHPDCDALDEGRGYVTLTWPRSALADGYGVYLWDGGAYRPVGRTFGAGSTTWSSGAQQFYPRDSEIRAMGWPGGGSGNPYYRAATPDDDTEAALLAPPTYVGSAGLLAGDGVHLFARARSSQDGPTRWQRIDPSTGTTTPFGPDLATRPALSAFFSRGAVYSGYVTKGTRSSLQGVASDSGATTTLRFDVHPIERDTGVAIAASTHDVLLACDGSHIFNVAYTRSTSDGAPVFDGFVVRRYTITGEFVSDRVLTMPSFKLSHVLADDRSLYLCEWRGREGQDGARVFKVDKTSLAPVNEWRCDQGGTKVCAGFYDTAHDRFWLGSLQRNEFRCYRGVCGGRDLRDDPRLLYERIDGASAEDARTHYRFCVVPLIDGVDGPDLADPTTVRDEQVPVTLPNRTRGVNDDPRHTVVSLGDWDGHHATCALDEGRLEVATCDLEIATWGPRAALTRHYSSARTDSTTSAPGWRFDFERRLEFTSPTLHRYIDECGEAHRFVFRDGAWHTPPGFDAVLCREGAEWRLATNDEDVLWFDASGALARVTDAVGNATTYSWRRGALVIRAANGQSIVVERDASGVVRAAGYHTADGTRRVDYDLERRTVTYFPGVDGLERTVEYTYATDRRLDGIMQHAWPTADESVRWGFIYGKRGGPLREVDFPDHDPETNPSARLDVVYGDHEATVYRYGRVRDIDGVRIASERLCWAECGAVIQREVTPEAGLIAAWRYRYGPGNRVSQSYGPDGTAQLYAADVYGNLLALRDEGGDWTEMEYDYRADATGRLERVSEADGGVTVLGYDSRGRLTASTRQVDDRDDVWARAEYGYDSAGRLARERHLVDGRVLPQADGSFAVEAGRWCEVDYGEAGYSLSGQPLTVRYRDVRLVADGAPVDLESCAGYDAFGNAVLDVGLHEVGTGDGGARRVRAYDLAGRCVADTGPPCGAYSRGATTRTVYDALGQVVERWAEHPSTPVRAGWVKYYLRTDPAHARARGLDAMGRVIKEWRYLHDGTTATLQSVVSHRYDGRGLEWYTDDSTLGGIAGSTVYDERGHPVQEWQEGASARDDMHATRTTYDAQGRVVGEARPAAVTALETTYTPEGDVAGERWPGSGWVTYDYDSRGDLVRETSPLTAGDDGATPRVGVRTDMGHDLSGREVWCAEADGQLTRTAYDLLGNAISTDDGSGASVAQVNVLGWVLADADADGVSTRSTYDGGGRVRTTQVGDQPATILSYDASGNEVERRHADGRRAVTRYDCFGRAVEQRLVSPTGDDVSHTLTEYDSLHRAVRQEETVGGRCVTLTYPQDAPTGLQVTVRHDEAASVSTRVVGSPRGVEVERETTVAGAPDTVVTRRVMARDAADRCTRVTFAGATACRSFDDAGRETRVWGSGFAAQAADTVSAEYDPATGRKTREHLELAFGGTIESEYSYTPTGRLRSHVSPGTGATYRYDEHGNLVEAECEGSVTEYQYDRADRLRSAACSDGRSSMVYWWDEATGRRTGEGATASTPSATYAYSADGRLVSYRDATPGHVVRADYAYDAVGRRVRSEVEADGTSTTTEWSFDGRRVVALRARRGDETWRIDYLYDEDGAPYAGVYRSSMCVDAPVVFAMVTASRGDVVELLDLDGVPFVAYRYDAWGVPDTPQSRATGRIAGVVAARIAERQVLRYAGYVYDAELGPKGHGMYCLWARHYDPSTRQFLSKDPEKADGEESPYQYCSGDPVGAVDPSGTKTIGYYLPEAKARRLRVRIRNIAVRLTDRKIPYRLWSWNYKKGPCDCASFARGILHSAGVRGMTDPMVTGGSGYVNGDVLRDWARWRGQCSISHFDENPGTADDVDYRIGDVLIERGVHTVLVISDGHNPLIAECTANDYLGPDHHQDATGANASDVDGSARLRLKHRRDAHGWRPYESGRYFKWYAHNLD